MSYSYCMDHHLTSRAAPAKVLPCWEFCTLLRGGHFSPMTGTLFFFRPLKMVSSLLSVTEIFQHQGSGNSFRGAKGSLYWSCPIQIPPKCWRWSNLVQASQIPCDRSNKGCQNVVGRRNGNWAIVCDECSQFLSNKLKASPFSENLCIGCHDHPTSKSFIFCSECSDWFSDNPDGLYESQWGVWMPDQDNPGVIMCYDLDHDGKL